MAASPTSPASDTKRSFAAASTKRRWSIKKIAAFIVVTLIAFLTWWGMQPVYLTGSPLFGLCRTYIELTIPYAKRLQFVDLIDNFDGKVAVDYIYTDAFGENLYTSALCSFKPDPQTGTPIMTSFRYRRGGSDRTYRFVAESDDHIAAFNQTIPGLLLDPPALRILALPKDIKEYK
ncbi:MAG: hypothetical protein V4621_01835 [Pseudomonadota bacterium]